MRDIEDFMQSVRYDPYVSRRLRENYPRLIVLLLVGGAIRSGVAYFEVGGFKVPLILDLIILCIFTSLLRMEYNE